MEYTRPAQDKRPSGIRVKWSAHWLSGDKPPNSPPPISDSGTEEGRSASRNFRENVRLAKLEVLVLMIIWTDRINLGWQLMRVPVTTSPGCTNTEATQSSYSPDKGDERLEEALNEENPVDVEVKIEQ
ncbi:hypothetical protein LR48_Vigan10g213100 [Vigna angularis]|uniref:Uncharacterized protein n=1 Tax=Phaseolus angularis TaxID=3914 RepID=A0A0L9VNB1_PHAAN|nr:hypothetical protein LR48_Vigan10g213100 [Vigna angularis]